MARQAGTVRRSATAGAILVWLAVVGGYAIRHEPRDALVSQDPTLQKVVTP